MENRKSPKVSIIMPVYNGEEFLKTALDSVINQTLKEIELICINDGSTDNSLQILEEYAKNDDRIKIYSQKNQGQGAARNKGLEVFNGEYVMFLDCDDYYEPQACEKAYNTALEQDVPLVLYTAKTFSYVAPIDEGTENAVKLKKFNSYLDRKVISDKSNGNYYLFPVAVWMRLYHKNYFKEMNIRFPEGLIYEDIPFTYEIQTKTKEFYVLSDCLYNYYYPRENQTTSNKTMKVLDIFKVFQYFENKIGDKISFHNNAYLCMKYSYLIYWYTHCKFYVKIPYFFKLRQELFKLYLEGWTDDDISKFLPIDKVKIFLNLNFIASLKLYKKKDTKNF